MNRLRLLHAFQSAVDLPRAGALAASLAMLVNSITCISVNAQQRDPVDQRRLEAPIGHRQPRPRDLPPWLQQNENTVPGPRNGFDVGPEINICRGC